MLARWVRTWDSKVLRPLLLFIAKMGITPDVLTIGSLITVIISGLLLSQAHMTIGGFVLLFGGFLDGLDGELARWLNCETRFGAFLDSSYLFWMLDSGSWIPETKCRPVGTTFSRSKLRGNQPDKD